MLSEPDLVLSYDRSVLEKLADCRNDGLMVFWYGAVWDSGGGPGRRSEF